MTGVVSRFDLHRVTYARLKTLEDGLNPIFVYDARPASVPMNRDRTGVAKYVVLFAGAGSPTDDGADLGGAARDLDWPISLLVVGAAANEVLYALDQVDGLLLRWRPSGLDPLVNTDGFVPPPGYDPGPVRVNDEVKPPRFSLPYQYRLTATT